MDRSPPKWRCYTVDSPCVPNVIQIAMIEDDLVVLTGSPQIEKMIRELDSTSSLCSSRWDDYEGMLGSGSR